MRRKSLLMILLLALFAPWAANAQTTLWSEDFEGGSMPSGWTTDGNGSWSVATAVNSTHPSSAGHGTYCAQIKHGTKFDATKLITPEIDLSSVTSAELSFMRVNQSWAGDIDALRVYYRTSTSGTWTLLDEFTDAQSNWHTEEGIVLPNLSSTYQIAFEYYDLYGYGLGIDYINIVQGASCVKPAALAATPNGQSATLTWVSDATQWAVAYSTNPDADPSDNVVTTVSSPTYTMNDLALDQDHYFWVRANCSATDQSAWAGPVSVHIGYCVPAPTSVDNDGITNVTFGTGSNIVNNDTPTATYTDYTSLSGDVQAGIESTIAITFNTHYTYNTYVWVDLDNSLSFDADEVICYGESESSYPTTLTLTFTINPNQPAGSYRMRIGSADSGLGSDPTAADPCYSSAYACFQDYTLNVLAAPNCLTPSGLALTTDGETVTATWNGTASTYNIDINGTVTNGVTSPYTFNCALSTTYTVMVQADCGGGETSDWTSPKSITTPDCIGGRTIEYSLVDSYGDGWNDNAILVYDECGNLINSLTLESGSSISGTLELCEGYYEFVFLEGGYKDETSWTFTENGVTLFSGAGEDIVSGDVLYALGNPTKPTDLVATINSTSADLRWTENGSATAWQICLDGNEANLIEANSNPFTLTGLNPGAIYGVKVRSVNGGTYTCWSSDYTFVTSETCESPTVPTASDIAPFSANVVWTPEEGEFEFRYREVAPQDNYFEDGTLGAWTTIDADGDGNTWYPLGEGTIPGYNASMGHVTSASYNNSGALTPDNYLVSPQVALGGSFSFWACNQDAYAETIGVAVSIASNDDPADFTMLKTITLPLARGGAYTEDSRSGNRAQTPWVYFYVDLSAYAGQTGYVAIRHYNCTDKFRVNVDNIVIEQPGDEWTVVSNATSPVALADLTPETEYEMLVRTVCHGNDYSRWMSNTFTTPSNCDAPSELLATPLVTEATLEWTGYQENYIVRYREPGLIVSDTLYFEGFEAGLPSTWTTVDADGDGYNWEGHINTGSGNYTAHSGDGVAYSESYSSDEGSALNPDNWLISPQLDLRGVLSVWLTAQDPNYPDEHFAIYLSTTGTEVSNFTTVLVPETVATGEYKEYTANLNAYAGQQGYIAIRHFNCSDMFILNVDDFAIYEAEENDWNEVQVTGLTTVDITGLEAETEYEWQVQGINRSCDGEVTEWSELMTFTTAGACDDPINLEATDITASSATLNWLGYQDSFNLRYRTAEVIDDISFYDNCSAQGDWTTSNLETDNEGGSGWDLLSGYFTFIYTTNPPQYLISPVIEAELNNSTLWFQYFAYGGEEYPETFQVGFSSTDNDVNSFTWGDEITATNDDEFLSYVAAVPNDAKYFAVKCTSYDAFALVLDNFVICDTYVAPGEWTNLTNVTSPTTIEGLEDNTEYDWEVQGLNCDGNGTNTEWVYSYFTTLEETNLTQTIALTTGVNWVSFYVETDLDALKAALVEALPGTSGMKISSKTQVTTYNGSRWRGQLNALDMAQMYRVTVPVECEITLEGMLVDPAEHPITIIEGANWIGYPFTETMAPANAFAGFAISGDKVSSKTQVTTYNGTRWRGQLTTLVPGQGYIYNSPSTEERPFVYPTSTKKASNLGIGNKPFQKAFDMPIMKKQGSSAKPNEDCKTAKRINK